MGGSLRQQLQVSGEQWVRDCQQSSANFIDTEDGAMSLISPRADGVKPSLAPGTADLVWRQSLLYYHDFIGQKFCKRSLEWSTSSRDGNHISQVDFGSGLQPLAAYRTDGKVIARYVEEVKFENNRGLWSLKLKASQERYGSQDRETAEMTFMARPRN